MLLWLLSTITLKQRKTVSNNWLGDDALASSWYICQGGRNFGTDNPTWSCSTSWITASNISRSQRGLSWAYLRTTVARIKSLYLLPIKGPQELWRCNDISHRMCSFQTPMNLYHGIQVLPRGGFHRVEWRNNDPNMLVMSLDTICQAGKDSQSGTRLGTEGEIPTHPGTTNSALPPQSSNGTYH